MGECPDCNEFRSIIDPVPRHVHWCHERIAELEAERRGACEGMSFWADKSNEAQARAEKAEAEVERLQAQLDCHCLFRPHVEGCPMQKYEGVNP